MDRTSPALPRRRAAAMELAVERNPQRRRSFAMSSGGEEDELDLVDWGNNRTIRVSRHVSASISPPDEVLDTEF